MIDGLQILFRAPNKTNLSGLDDSWQILVIEKSNQPVDGIRTIDLRGLNIKLKPSSFGCFNLIINGSIHKYFNLGTHNADQFSFTKLQQAIDGLMNVLALDPKDCIVQGLEIGVNLILAISPDAILKNLVSLSGRPFTQINLKSAAKGQQSVFSQKKLKMYNKSLALRC